ncbi:MAG: hypothetical protein JXQ26_03220 [Tissierellales bacterium]|nr:hypothetical protein [Tissierellales bacterium]MBN2826971.1 hypothetical protein [Tissierellales bacterium]
MTEKYSNILYPFELNNANIKSYYKLDEELRDIIEESGSRETFIRLYRQRLKFLGDRKYRAIDKRDWFESLKNEKDLYAIKIKNKLNIRIVYTMMKIKDIDFIILLSVFKEKDKKDYEKAIRTARKRMGEIK